MTEVDAVQGVSRVAKGRAGAVRDTPFERTGVISIGIDPGSRYTGIVVCDGEDVIHASTIVRAKDGDQDAVVYAKKVIEEALVIVTDYRERFGESNIVMGVEGVVDPKGFNGGKKAFLNPKDILRVGVTTGAMIATFPTATVIRPRNNGSQHVSQYPDSLQGRRPKSLEGDSNKAGTRRHEQSAYDVAKKSMEAQAQVESDAS